MGRTVRNDPDDMNYDKKDTGRHRVRKQAQRTREFAEEIQRSQRSEDQINATERLDDRYYQFDDYIYSHLPESYPYN